MSPLAAPRRIPRVQPGPDRRPPVAGRWDPPAQPQRDAAGRPAVRRRLRLLLLTTSVALTRSLRDASEAEPRKVAPLPPRPGAVWELRYRVLAAWGPGPVGATLLFGFVVFLALREFITLTHTWRADHRSLVLAFFVVLPLQFVLAGRRPEPVHGLHPGLRVPRDPGGESALGDDPQRFLERTAKIQWGLMVCVSRHEPRAGAAAARVPGYREHAALLVLFYLCSSSPRRTSPSS